MSICHLEGMRYKVNKLREPLEKEDDEASKYSMIVYESKTKVESKKD